MTNEVRIVLVGASKEAHDKMLAEARADKKVSINSSRLVNWIVQDYFDNFFEKRKSKLCKAHLNSRKYMLAVMRESDPQEVRRALQELARSLSPTKSKNDPEPDGDPEAA